MVACYFCVMAPNMDEIFKALGEESRRKLLDLLLFRNGRTLTELCDEMPGVSRQGVSKHLGVLERAKLVKVKWRGKEKMHHLDAAPMLDTIWRWINKHQRARREKARG